MVIEVEVPESGDLYEAIRSSGKLQELIRTYVLKHGCKIQFFNTRAGIEEELVKDLGFVWGHHVASFPSSRADHGNDKGWVRRLAKKLLATSKLRRDIFPRNVVLDPRVMGLRRLQIYGWYAFLRVMTRGRVAIKETSEASGMGQLFTDEFGKVLKFVSGRPGLRRKSIVEVDIGPHISMTHLDEYRDGTIVDTWQTIQVIGEVDGRKVDLGRVLTTERRLPWLSSDDFRFMKWVAELMNPTILLAVQNPTGVMCWDCARSLTSGTQYALELNMRVTFSYYVRKLMLRVRELTGKPHITAIQVKVDPARARSFRDLQQELGELMYARTRGEGCVPIALRCLESAEPYVYITVLAGSIDRALRMAEETAIALGDQVLHRAIIELGDARL